MAIIGIFPSDVEPPPAAAATVVSYHMAELRRARSAPAVSAKTRCGLGRAPAQRNDARAGIDQLLQESEQLVLAVRFAEHQCVPEGARQSVPPIARHESEGNLLLRQRCCELIGGVPGEVKVDESRIEAF